MREQSDGGVEPETVDEFLEDGQVVLWRVREKGASEDEWSAWTDFDFESSHEFYDRTMVEVEEVKFVPLSALRLVEEELRQAREERDNWKERAGANDQDREDESQLRAEAEANWQRESALLRRAEADRDRLAEELRQAREVAHSRLRDRARLVRRAERAEANLDLLIRRFALVSARSGMRAQALQLAEECITENVANGEGVDSQPAVLDAIFDALKYEITDEPDSARPGAKSPIQSAPVSPVQGEHEQDGEDAGVVGDSALPGESVRGELREEFVVCLAAGYPDPYGPTPNTYEKALEFQREHGGRVKRRVSSLWEWVGEMVERPNDDSEATR